MILSLATACGSASPKAEPVVLSPGRGVPTTGHAVWVVGFAQQSKLGAIVTAGKLAISTDRRSSPPPRRSKVRSCRSTAPGWSRIARATPEASCPAFLNADLIAAGLSPFNPARAALRAGRLMLELIAEHVARGESFAFETTLAGRNFARAIEQWRAAGYHISLIFLSLPSADLAVQRVAQRVRQGGARGTGGGRSAALHPRLGPLRDPVQTARRPMGVV